MTSPLEWVFLLPFGGAALTFVLRGRWPMFAGVAISAATFAAAVWLAVDVWNDGARRYAFGAWDPPLGIVLDVNGFAALMLLATALLMTLVFVYATGYFRDESAHDFSGARAFTPLALLMLGSLNALFLSSDLFNLYVSLELLTLAGVGMVIIAGDRVAVVAAMRYLLTAFMASLFYLLGVAILYASHDALDIALISSRIEPGTTSTVALAVIFGGLMVKAALFPFHGWLPAAHASAPAPVSAILSGLVVAAAFFVALKLWVAVAAVAIDTPLTYVVGGLGTAGIVWGSLQAMRGERLKMVIAHSTVAQMGFLFLLFPLLGNPDTAASWPLNAWQAGGYHIVSHAFAKASLFMCAGTLLYAFGSDRIRSLYGLSTTLPLTMFAFGIAGVALVGLPPSGGFLAKWLLLRAALESPQWWWAAVVGIGTLLSGAYVVRLVRVAYSAEEPPATMHRRPPRVMEWTSLLLALIALVLGLRASEALELLEIGAPLTGAMPWGAF